MTGAVSTAQPHTRAPASTSHIEQTWNHTLKRQPKPSRQPAALLKIAEERVRQHGSLVASVMGAGKTQSPERNSKASFTTPINAIVAQTAQSYDRAWKEAGIAGVTANAALDIATVAAVGGAAVVARRSLGRFKTIPWQKLGRTVAEIYTPLTIKAGKVHWNKTFWIEQGLNAVIMGGMQSWHRVSHGENPLKRDWNDAKEFGWSVLAAPGASAIVRAGLDKLALKTGWAWLACVDCAPKLKAVETLKKGSMQSGSFSLGGSLLDQVAPPSASKPLWASFSAKALPLLLPRIIAEGIEHGPAPAAVHWASSTLGLSTQTHEHDHAEDKTKPAVWVGVRGKGQGELVYRPRAEQGQQWGFETASNVYWLDAARFAHSGVAAEQARRLITHGYVSGLRPIKGDPIKTGFVIGTKPGQRGELIYRERLEAKGQPGFQYGLQTRRQNYWFDPKVAAYSGEASDYAKRLIDRGYVSDLR